MILTSLNIQNTFKVYPEKHLSFTGHALSVKRKSLLKIQMIERASEFPNEIKRGVDNDVKENELKKEILLLH